MSDPNPYEPPKSLEPLTKRQVAKRATGLVMVLVLTPAAILATFFVTCTVAWVAGGTKIDEPEPPIFWVITLVPTALVAVGMLIWAVRRLRRR